MRDGLRCLQLSGALFVRAHLSRPWAYHSPELQRLQLMLKPGDRRIILFHIITEGSCRATLNDGGGEADLVAGDIVILPFAGEHTVGDPEPVNPVDLAAMMPSPPWASLPIITFGGGGPTTTILCGYLLSDDAPLNPVLASLPRFMRVRSAQSPLARWVESSVQYAMHASQGRSGTDDPLSQRLPELLFMEALCQYVRQERAHTGWLAGLADPVVGRALGCMHGQPAYPWTLNELARRAAASRSTLDDRFRMLLGRAPMSYLIAYRLQLAGRQLRSTNATLAEIAELVGYGPEAAFSRAFKRHTGAAPGEWRQGATLRSAAPRDAADALH
ncbi:MAG TPA: AraC family transcriptional regulator [Kofleriaceae bacterium]|nr:AraC family transcriptional regulator [Kofleriaceae bacterium]